MRGSGRLTIFFVFFVLSIFIFVFSKAGWMDGVSGGLQFVFLPVQRMTDGFFRREDTTELGRLKSENAVLRVEVAKMKAIEKDNAALRDQFAQSNLNPERLLPAYVVGMPAFLPRVFAVEEVIIDRGSVDKVKVGEVVVYKDILIGRVVRISPHLSVVDLISHDGISFTAGTSKTSALGVLSGKGGGEMVLENVLLSDRLEKGDTVVSKGDVGAGGDGVPAGLVVGKIVSVKRQASSLFQSAEVERLAYVERLKMVFVMR
jgi:rod shape-determining protein MreC